MKPAVALCMMSLRGVEAVAELLLDRHDFELITVEPCGTLLDMRDIPNRPLRDFTSPSIEADARLGARRRIEAVRESLSAGVDRFPEVESALARSVPGDARRVVVAGRAARHVAAAVARYAPDAEVAVVEHIDAAKGPADAVLLSDPLAHSAGAEEELRTAAACIAEDGVAVAAGLLEAAGMERRRREADVGAGDLDDTLRMVRERRPAGIVVDSYHVDEDYIDAIQREGVPVLMVDDFCSLSRYPCTAVLNFTVAAPDLAYPPEIPLGLYGPGYLLARRALRRRRGTVGPRTGTPRRALVAIGGADPDDLGGRVARALANADRSLGLHIVVGDGYRHRDALRELGRETRAVVEVSVQLPDLAEALCRADVAVCGGGLQTFPGDPTRNAALAFAGVLPQV